MSVKHALVSVRKAMIEHENRPDQKNYITVSMGSAHMLHAQDDADVNSLMNAADLKLYQAKNGRDQIKT